MKSKKGSNVIGRPSRTVVQVIPKDGFASRSFTVYASGDGVIRVVEIALKKAFGK